MNTNALEDEARLIYLARLVKGERNRPHGLRAHLEIANVELYPFLRRLPLQILRASLFGPVWHVELEVHRKRPFPEVISHELDHECDLILCFGRERACFEFSPYIEPRYLLQSGHTYVDRAAKTELKGF